MRYHLTATVAVFFSVVTALDANADNTVNVLQFGTTNLSFTSQAGPANNTSIALQFGATNRATSLQSGPLSSVNTIVIGQGGTTNTATNTAIAGQIGGINSSLIGQIGANNAAGVAQLGILNGSTILQASP